MKEISATAMESGERTAVSVEFLSVLFFSSLVCKMPTICCGY